MLDPIMWGSNARIETTFWVQIGAKGAVKVSESDSSASWGKVGVSWGENGYRKVMLKLSWAMLCHVEAICQSLFGHEWVLRPGTPGHDFKRFSASHVGSPNITHPTSHTQRDTLNITQPTSHIQHHTLNITNPTSHTQQHTHYHTPNITHPTSDIWRLSGVCPCHCDLRSIGGFAVALAVIDLLCVCVPAIDFALYRRLGCCSCRDWRLRAYVSLPLWFALYRNSAVALAAIDAFGRLLSCVCPCHCDLRSIGGSAVALAAIDAFGRPLSCVCPCHCDLRSIGGFAVALAAIHGFGLSLPLWFALCRRVCCCCCCCFSRDWRLRAAALFCVSLPCVPASIGGSAVSLTAIDTFEQRLSCVCPCHCDLHSIGGWACSLAVIDSSLLCVPAIVICVL